MGGLTLAGLEANLTTSLLEHPGEVLVRGVTAAQYLDEDFHPSTTTDGERLF